MNFIKNLKVPKKLGLLIFISVLISITIGSICIYNLRTISSASNQMYNDRLLPVMWLNDNRAQDRGMEAALFDLMITTDDNANRRLQKEIGDRTEKFRKNLTSYENTQLDSFETETLKILHNNLDQFIKNRKAVIDLAVQNKNTEAYKLYNQTVRQVSEELNKNLIDLSNYNARVAGELNSSNRDIAYRSNITFSTIIFFSVAILLFFGWLIAKSITQPLKEAVAHLAEMADGNFSNDISSARLLQGDEMGDLARSYNSLNSNIGSLIGQISTSSGTLVKTIEEIASGNQNLSQRTSEQASSIEEIAASIEEANASIKQNSGNAMEATQLAKNSSDIAVNGGGIVDKAILSIKDINSSSKKIAEIITMINEIAFQTNLLALNAAVEAARAGDQGRGFAVVAGEVRNLAQRSAGAAKEINILIEDSISKINYGTDMVNKSGDALKEIINSAGQVNNIVSEIATASEEQKNGIEQINTAILDMDSMVQQNAALVEETAAASDQITIQARDLLAMVQKFKIKQERETETPASQKTFSIQKTIAPPKKMTKGPVKEKTVPGHLIADIKNNDGYDSELDGFEKF